MPVELFYVRTLSSTHDSTIRNSFQADNNADDDDDDLELLATALRNFLDDFWPVIMVNSGKELLSLLEDKALFPALFVIDMHMPNLGGAGVLDLLRPINRIATVPKVLISGDKDNLQAAFSAGANGFYSKPTSLEEYGQVVHSIKREFLS